jgi:hypothetical protein
MTPLVVPTSQSLRCQQLHFQFLLETRHATLERENFQKSTMELALAELHRSEFGGVSADDLVHNPQLSDESVLPEPEVEDHVVLSLGVVP